MQEMHSVHTFEPASWRYIYLHSYGALKMFYFNFLWGFPLLDISVPVLSLETRSLICPLAAFIFVISLFSTRSQDKKWRAKSMTNVSLKSIQYCLFFDDFWTSPDPIRLSHHLFDRVPVPKSKNSNKGEFYGSSLRHSFS